MSQSHPKLSRLQTCQGIFCMAILLSLVSVTQSWGQESKFKILFDGKSLDGWKQKGNWKIEDGTLTRNGKGGGITFDAMQVPDDFELLFDWKVGVGSNSGVYYRPGQYEYQVLDNDVHRDGQNPRTSAASLYFCMQPSHDATNPVGQWNQGRIVCKGTIVQHWLNGQKVIHFDYADPNNSFNVKMLKLRGGDLAARGGKVMLQDHGDPVWYRNIQLRELLESDEIDMTPVTPAIIDEKKLAAEKEKLDGIVSRREKQRAKKEQQEKGVRPLGTID